jgi:hypothetical protein
MMLDDHLLQDIGLSRDEIARAAGWPGPDLNRRALGATGSRALSGRPRSASSGILCR